MLTRHPHRRSKKGELRPDAELHDVISLPKQWVWHYAALLCLRGRLMQKGDQHADSTTAEPLQPIAREFDLDIALSLLTDERDPLGEIDAALHRILEGSYGIAEASGEPISSVRLELAPWSRDNFGRTAPARPFSEHSNPNLSES